MQKGIVFVPHKKSPAQLLKYYKSLREYEKNVSEGNDSYKEFAKCVGMNLNLVMPSLRGWHR